MNKSIGKVTEVFIPKDNIELDIMDSRQIGFKIIIENELLEVIQEQNENNSKIMKDDLVIITRKDNKVLNIELYEGESYE